MGLHELFSIIFLVVCEPSVGIRTHIVARLHAVLLAGRDKLLHNILAVLVVKCRQLMRNLSLSRENTLTGDCMTE